MDEHLATIGVVYDPKMLSADDHAELVRLLRNIVRAYGGELRLVSSRLIWIGHEPR